MGKTKDVLKELTIETVCETVDKVANELFTESKGTIKESWVSSVDLYLFGSIDDVETCYAFDVYADFDQRKHDDGMETGPYFQIKFWKENAMPVTAGLNLRTVFEYGEYDGVDYPIVMFTDSAKRERFIAEIAGAVKKAMVGGAKEEVVEI